MKNCHEALIDLEGNRPRVWLEANAFGGFNVVREGAATCYGSVDHCQAVEQARAYCHNNNCRLVDDPSGKVKLPLPQFEAYVDQLAKSGQIDGNIAERMTAFHRQEVADPRGPARDAMRPILDEMFHASNSTTLEHLDAAKLALRGFAERIDDLFE